MSSYNMKKKDFNTTTTCTNNGFHKETTLKETKMSNLNCVSNDNLFINNSLGIDKLGIVAETRKKEILKDVNATGGIAAGTQNYNKGYAKGGIGGSGTVNIGQIRKNTI